jgi:hypothetical protein
MSEKDPSNKEDPSNEDEDFGLPKVNYNPVGPEKHEPEEEPVIPASNTGKIKNTDKSRRSTESSKGNGFLIVLLLFIIALGFGSLYYFGYLDSNSGEVTAPGSPPALSEDVSATPQPAETDENINTNVEREPSENVLSEIRGRAAAPRYFVVVGSFIDDDLAKDYSSKLNKSGKPTFLIHPYGDIAYYRLAVAQYDNVKQALAMMEDQQGNYEENLWVLKY